MWYNQLRLSVNKTQRYLKVDTISIGFFIRVSRSSDKYWIDFLKITINLHFLALNSCQPRKGYFQCSWTTEKLLLHDISKYNTKSSAKRDVEQSHQICLAHLFMQIRKIKGPKTSLVANQIPQMITKRTAINYYLLLPRK